jgi:hypothetical protein
VWRLRRHTQIHPENDQPRFFDRRLPTKQFYAERSRSLLTFAMAKFSVRKNNCVKHSMSAGEPPMQRNLFDLFTSPILTLPTLLLSQLSTTPALQTPIKLSFSRIVPVAGAIAHFPDAIIATPSGWTATTIINGVQAYSPPNEAAIALAIPPEQTANGMSGSPNGSSNGSSNGMATDLSSAVFDASDRLNGVDGNSIDGNDIDGTRRPYVNEIRLADLMAHPVAPGKYLWRTVWQGEGYDRSWEMGDRLVSHRENGADIHVTITYDTTMPAPHPNLRIVLENEQNVTTQVTNISAFYWSETGELLDRQDFGQLPPYYDITVTKNGGFGGIDHQVLEPLGVQTFAYRVSPEQLAQYFPLKLQGDNQFFRARQELLFELKTQGWEVKEIPPPSFS